MAATVESLNGYWSSIADSEELPYTTPDVVSHRAGELPATSCADDTEPDEWRDRASYCFGDNTIVYDADFLHRVFEREGPDAASGILAHEWGHHLQALTTVPEFPIQMELQADCFAGTFLANVSGDPAESGPSLAAMGSFVERGNEEYAQSAWFDFEEHGSPAMRWSAFVTGALGIDDLSMCLGYTTYEPQPPIELGTYTLAHLPSFRTRATDAEATLTRSGVELHVVPLNSPPGATAEEIGLAVWDDYFEGLTFLERPPVQVQPTPWGGEWASWAYEATNGGSRYIGLLRIHTSPAGSGLLVDASMKDPPVEMPLDPEEERILMGIVMPAYTIENFLCTPDQSPDPGSGKYSFSCSIEFPQP